MSGTKGETHDSSNGGSSYHEVDRDWVQGGNSSQPHGTSQSAVQRWQAELTRDQPYHGIQAVRAEERHNGGGTKVEGCDSSVEYFDPREKKA